MLTTVGLLLAAAAGTSAPALAGEDLELASPLLDQIDQACRDGEVPVARSVNSLTGVEVTVSAVCAGQGPSGQGGPTADTHQCPSTAYTLLGWSWTVPATRVERTVVMVYEDQEEPGYLSGVEHVLRSAAEAWDDHVTGELFLDLLDNDDVGGSPDTLDGVNLMAWDHQPGQSFLAFARTYSYGGIAFESDHIYNTAYTWATSPGSSSFTLSSTATHEMGHTYGLGHVSTASQNQCLIMYPYSWPGEDDAFGAGDILGIQAIYD